MEISEYARMHELESRYWWFVGRRAIIRRLLNWQHTRFAACKSSSRWLDIGCGTGANLPMLRELADAGDSGSPQVTAMDFSPHALRFARNDGAAQGLNLLQGDALRLPFRSNTFAVATMLDVLEHLPDDECALHELHRVLQPGGRFVFSVPAYQHLWSAHDTALHHFRRYERRDLAALLHRNGFQVARLSFAMSLMPPVAWLWRKTILPFQNKRPKNAKRHSQGAVLPDVPSWFNRALIGYLEIEGRILVHRPINFGTSLVGVAVKK